MANTDKRFEQPFKLDVWHGYLESLYSKLSEYEVQKNRDLYNVANVEDWGKGGEQKGIKINEKNIKRFVDILERYKLAYYHIIKKLDITSSQIEELNRLLDSAFKSEVTMNCDEPNELFIVGKFVKFSDFVGANSLKPTICKHDISELKKITVFALNTVFIDRDLFLSIKRSFVLNVIAPKWQVIGTVTISLDGIEGRVHNPAKAKDGSGSITSGEHGKPGLPGGTGGNFFGIAGKIFDADKLSIYSVGGRGGPGQDGGNGKDGKDGVYARPSRDRPQCSSKLCQHGYETLLASDNSYQKFKCLPTNEPLFFLRYEIPDWFPAKKPVCNVKFAGTTLPAGSGGDGGIGGKGGHQGYIVILQLGTQNDVAMVTLDRPEGRKGKGGIGGRTGRKGDDVLLKYEHQTGWTEVSRIVDKTPSLPRKNGIDGANNKDRENPAIRAKIEPAHVIVNKYKQYLMDDMMDYSKKHHLEQFLKGLNDNAFIQISYTTEAFVQELTAMEERVYILSGKIDLQPIYQSFLDRITEYAQNSQEIKDSILQRGILKYCYTAALSRIYSLKDHSDSILIIDVLQYLDSIEKIFEKLQVVQERGDRLNMAIEKTKAINMYRESYNSILKDKTENAKNIIEKITSEIDDIGRDVGSETDILIQQVNSLEAQYESQKEQYIQLKRQLADKLVLRIVFGLMKVVGLVATCFPPVGLAVGLAITGVSATLESLLLSGNEDPPKLIDLPNSLTNIDDKMKDVDEETNRIGNLMNRLSEEIQRRPEGLLDQSERIGRVMTDEGRQKRGITRPVPAKSASDPGSLRGAPDIVSNTYGTVSGDNTVTNSVDELIKQTDQNIAKLEAYKKQIDTIMIPKLHSIVENLKETVNLLRNKSRVVLDVSKWSIQSILGDINLWIGQVTRGFDVSDDLQHSIKKLQAAMEILIKVFDDIQEYQEQSRLANYVADLGSVIASETKISDQHLIKAKKDLEISIESNFVLQQYQLAVSVLKRFKFPFAEVYFKRIQPPSYLETKKDFADLVSDAKEQITKVKSNLMIQTQSIDDFDECIGSGEFSSYYQSVRPFYVWKNEDYGRVISNLLSGQEVILRADIANSLPSEDAIKFNSISLNMKVKDPSLQSEINAALLDYKLNMTHLGDSYYRYNGKSYLITSVAHEFSFTIQKKDFSNEPVKESDSYKKMRLGEPQLSPYAMWKVKLFSDSTVSNLEKFIGTVDLELIGHASFVMSNRCFSLNVDEYYNATDINPPKIEFDDKAYQTSPREKRESEDWADEDVDNIEHEPAGNVASSAISSPINSIINWCHSHSFLFLSNLLTSFNSIAESVENRIVGRFNAENNTNVPEYSKASITEMNFTSNAQIFADGMETKILNHMDASHESLEFIQVRDENSSAEHVQNLDGGGMLLLADLALRSFTGEKYKNNSYLSPVQERSLEMYYLNQKVQRAIQNFESATKLF